MIELVNGPQDPRSKRPTAEETKSKIEKVSQTAWLVAYKRALTDIPFAHAVYSQLRKLREKSGETNELKHLESTDKAITIEARYKIVDKLLEESNIKQVIEIASGLSMRGLDKTNDAEFKYVEIDLPGSVAEKKQIMNSIIEDQGLTKRPNLFVEENDVLKPESIDQCLKHFDQQKPVAILNEGLLGYFNNEQKEVLAKNIHQILEKHGGVWITPDIRIRKETLNNETERAAVMNFIGMDPTDNFFNSEEQAFQFFADIGFKIEKHPFSEVLSQISVHKNLGLHEDESGEVEKEIEDRFAYVMSVK